MRNKGKESFETDTAKQNTTIIGGIFLHKLQDNQCQEQDKTLGHSLS